MNPGVLVASSDNMKALPDSIAGFMPRPLFSLGTEGFGRSETRPALRDFFEVDARYVTLATLTSLARNNQVTWATVSQAIKDLGINPEKLNPLSA